MPVPKKRHTKSKRNMRRSHHALTLSSVTLCPQCKRLIRPHHMCAHCGYYKGQEIVDVLAKLTRRERKQRERAEKQRQAEQQAAAGQAT